MSRDPQPDDEAVRDLLQPLRRIAYAIERLVQLQPGHPALFATCSYCGCALVEVPQPPGPAVDCPACGATL